MRFSQRLFHIALGAAIPVALLAGYAVGAAEPDVPVGAEVPETRAGASSPSGSVFVPITPCRIVSTAVAGGKYSVGQTRSFKMAGDVATQGGKAGGCGIPATASALEITVAAPLAEGTGYLRAWPGAQSEPGSTFMGFGTGPSFTNTGTVAVSPGASNNLKVKVYGARTHVLIDVQGYYTKGLMAQVASDGSSTVNNGVLDSDRIAVGTYRLQFDRDISGCAYVANAFALDANAVVFGDGGTTAKDDILVYVYLGGVLSDAFVAVIVTC